MTLELTEVGLRPEAAHVVVPGLERLTPLSLAELCARPDLQTRVDRKYVVPSTVVADLVEQVHGDSAVLVIDGRAGLRYVSVYFDTVDLTCYLAAAHGRRRRYKVRTRSYLDTETCLLEAKTVGGRGETVKRRAPYPFADRDRLTEAGRDVLQGWLGPELPDLFPTLTTSYLRTTLVDAAGARVTVDGEVRGEVPDGGSEQLAGNVIVETKSPAAATATDRWFWARGYRPVRLSKYAVGLAALQPELPANRWARTLRRWYPQS